MSFLKYINRLMRMDALIRRKATGSPEEFAKKMGMSRSALMRDLAEIKELDAPVAYDMVRQTYYYVEEVELNFSFRKISQSAMTEQFGGSYFQEIFQVSQYETHGFHI